MNFEEVSELFGIPLVQKFSNLTMILERVSASKFTTTAGVISINGREFLVNMQDLWQIGSWKVERLIPKTKTVKQNADTLAKLQNDLVQAETNRDDLKKQRQDLKQKIDGSQQLIV